MNVQARAGQNWVADDGHWTEGRRGDGVAPAELGGAVRRHAGLVATFVALGMLAGAAVWWWSSPTYSATSVVTLQAITSDPYAGNTRPADLVNPASEADLLRSTAVAADVRSRLGLRRTTADLLDAVTVAVPADSLSLQVTATDPQPLVAQRLADAFSASYLDRRQATARRSVERQVAAVDARLVEQRRLLTNAVTVQQTAAPTSPERAAAVADADLARSRISALETTRAQLTAVDTTPGQIAVAAPRPQNPAGVPGWLQALGAALLIALLGILLAVWMDSTSTRRHAMHSSPTSGGPGTGTRNGGAPARNSEVMAG
jgi:hypothetical protein